MKKAETKDRIREALEIREMKQAELVEKTGIDKGQMSSYLAGRYKPKQNNLHLMAKALSVDEAWLMGYDVPMERDDYWENEKHQEIDFHSFIHDYLGYESPYTLDGKVDLILKKEPNTIYRVSAGEYDNFYEITKERIEQEFSFLLRRAEKLSKKSEESLIPFPQEDKSYLEPQAAHERTDIEVTDEMRKHDNDIMDDDDFWNGK